MSVPCLDLERIRAITLDLDDTLWPVWPAIDRAEVVLQAWLANHAPATHALYAEPGALRTVRNRMNTERPDLAHDLSALRRESIRVALQQAGDNPALAEPAFEVFFAERQRVELFEGVVSALEFLAARYPVLALTNGNADVHRVGIGQYFCGSVHALQAGVAKPDARMFQLAAQTLQLPVEAVLHVGDDAVLDVQGARRAGMQAVWVNTAAQVWSCPNEPQPVMVPGLPQLCSLLA